MDQPYPRTTPPVKSNSAESRFIRKRELLHITGLSYSTIWRREREGDFPARVRLSPGAVGWRLSEVEEWLNGLPLAEEGA